MDSLANFSTEPSLPSQNRQDVFDQNQELAQELNDEMTRAVLPVTIFVGIEVLAAFFGNLLVIYVFLFRYHECNFRYFVLCLAFTDFTSSLTTMPGEMVTQLYWYVYPVPQICKIKSFFNIFTVASEALCLLTIGFDRYLKVCRPLTWQMKPRHAKYICGFIYFIAFVLAIPVYIFWGTHSSQKVYRNRNITVTVCEKDQKWLDTDHPLQYSVTVEVILSLCLTVMFGLYILIAKKLLKNTGIRFRTYTLRKKSTAKTSSDSTQTNSSVEAADSGKFMNSDQRRSTPLQNTTRESTENTEQIQEALQNNIDDEMFPERTENLSHQREDFDSRKIGHGKETLPKHIKRILFAPNTFQENLSTLPSSGNVNNRTSRAKRKTLIVFILTIVFVITTILYLTLLSYIAKSVLDTLSDGAKAVYFFFFRLYFINHVINPIVYGILDPHFRKVTRNIRGAISTNVSETSG